MYYDNQCFWCQCYEIDINPNTFWFVVFPWFVLSSWFWKVFIFTSCFDLYLYSFSHFRSWLLAIHRFTFMIDVSLSFFIYTLIEFYFCCRLCIRFILLSRISPADYMNFSWCFQSTHANPVIGELKECTLRGGASRASFDCLAVALLAMLVGG